MEDKCKDNIKVGNKCRMVVDSHWCGYDNNILEHSNSSTEARVILRSFAKHVLSLKATSFATMNLGWSHIAGMWRQGYILAKGSRNAASHASVIYFRTLLPYQLAWQAFGLKKQTWHSCPPHTHKKNKIPPIPSRSNSRNQGHASDDPLICDPR